MWDGGEHSLPRARVDLGTGWRDGMASRLEPVIVSALKKSPLCDEELLSLSITALGAESGISEIGADVKKLWSLQHERSIADRTAIHEVLRNVRAVLSIVKKRLLSYDYCEKTYGIKVSKVGRRIQFGRRNFGEVYFVENKGGGNDWKKGVSSLARKLVLDCAEKTSAVRTILDALEKDDYVRVKSLPHQYRSIKQAADLLKDYWLAEEKTLSDGTRVITVPGFSAESISIIKKEEEGVSGGGGGGWNRMSVEESFAREFFEKNSATPSSLKFFNEKFSANTWTIGPDGPRVSKISFSIVVFDKASQILEVADCSEKRAGTAELKELHSKKLQWGLPARMHYFAPNFSSAARTLADELGVVLHETA